MELKDFKDVVRVMTKEEFESTIEEDIKFVEGFKNFLKHDDATRIVEHIKSVLEASVDYYYPNHPEVEFEKDFNIQYDVNNILNKYGHTEMGMYKIQLYIENILGSIQNKKPVDVGEVSDGYHTFNELYRYRMLYNAAFFNLLARSGQVEVCKSRRHSDGEKCFGSFERQEKESGFNFLYNPNNGRMRSGHIIIDGIGLFKQIIESGT